MNFSSKWDSCEKLETNNFSGKYGRKPIKNYDVSQIARF